MEFSQELCFPFLLIPASCMHIQSMAMHLPICCFAAPPWPCYRCDWLLLLDHWAVSGPHVFPASNTYIYMCQDIAQYPLPSFLNLTNFLPVGLFSIWLIFWHSRALSKRCDVNSKEEQEKFPKFHWKHYQLTCYTKVAEHDARILQFFTDYVS